jgi:xylulokinase
MTMNRYLLGLDLGTSALKAALFTTDGQIAALQRVTYPTYEPHLGWAEQEAGDWWLAACQAIPAVIEQAGVSPHQILALGLAGQSPGHLLVDEQAQPLRRAIIWSDRRATHEAQRIAETLPPDQLADFTGHSFPPSPFLPTARLLWLRDHCPDLWRRAHRVLQPKDYLLLKLTGCWCTDLPSCLELVNETGRPRTEYLEPLGLSAGMLPQPLKSHQVAGHVSPEAARLTGLPAGCPVVCGTIDARCSIFGAGGVRAGRAVDVAGSSEVIALIVPRGMAQTVFNVPLAGDLFYAGGPMQMGGGALEWLRQGFYPELASGEGYGAIEAEAASVSPGSEGLLFLPYLRGERAPIWDERARGAFVGLTAGHIRAHCARAVYEGVALNVRQILEGAEERSALRVDALRVCGGGGVSRLWNQIKADVLHRPVLQPRVLETTALGASILAGVGIGVFDGLEEAGERMVHIERAFEPHPEAGARYDTLFAIYRSLYPSLRDAFWRLGGVGTWVSSPLLL